MLLFLLSIFAPVQAHMGMSQVLPSGTTVQPREKAALNDNYRSPLKPGYPVCHGTAKIPVQAEIDAGSDIKGRTSGGAGHGGGHCAMFVSVDEKTWYKISDKKDCTIQGNNPNAYPWKLPAGVPKQCAEAAGCTFAWLWTPMLSGTCEIYMNCYHFRVKGAEGGIESQEDRRVTMPIEKCIRPNSRTHFTTHFGKVQDPFVDGDSSDVTSDDSQVPVLTTPSAGGAIPIDREPGDPECESGDVLYLTGLPEQYEVQQGDTLNIIASKFDLKCSGENCESYDQLYELNKCPSVGTHQCDPLPTCMAGTVDQICVAQILKLPQKSCDSSPCSAHGLWYASVGKCACFDGYTGPTCEQKPDPSLNDPSTPVMNGGIIAVIVVLVVIVVIIVVVVVTYFLLFKKTKRENKI